MRSYFEGIAKRIGRKHGAFKNASMRNAARIMTRLRRDSAEWHALICEEESLLVAIYNAVQREFTIEGNKRNEAHACAVC